MIPYKLDLENDGRKVNKNFQKYLAHLECFVFMIVHR